ncbi:hypothetical protein F441_04195 [Phytophthora nicotianae CJ01A1]|uniref:Uncharacterized protein n=6 Tax=Phytophthora nicotianae TaxID=4792 RepID=W2QME9_PHYN3|nr:hypothetical protein PPTG_22354 [Phytophthora nicotianae INRA-310]ETI52697.1 hypothetical protein F443_04248 [Phytophthora nicotianae P1569]ETK92586.1 hypothetical protein L915_04108 [Phytophthora nicotianae]ETO81395.1 hypothetical protein F444_04300 [Phytophthora nicotianae P1976]ETP22551.1 hypothetical protein F441_04195 [Phytophthora nicotianae CJ01A1]ETP50513.1 hypothetical protein F442_04214 [Phytophthora nicotianae P10297]
MSRMKASTLRHHHDGFIAMLRMELAMVFHVSAVTM